jgi:hypothetical protein
MTRNAALCALLSLAVLGISGCKRQEPVASTAGPAAASSSSSAEGGGTERSIEPADPRFAEYPPGEAFTGKPAEVDVASHPSAETFQSFLRKGAAGGPNFSGHLTLVSMECGANCQGWMVVDARTGKVYDGFASSVGAQFRKDSSLVIANPPGEVTPGCKCATELYAWKGERLEKIE